MRARGINYDTGFLPGGGLSRKTLTPETVRRDMEVISGVLHCDAVRVSGRDPERLSTAARYAADAGLEVWFAPFPVDLPDSDLLPFLADCARRAEILRRGGAEVVLVAGCEISAFCGGFIPGDQDLGSYGVVRIFDEARWEPKKVFHAMAAGHRRR